MNSNSFTNSTSDHDDDTDSQVRGAGKSGRVIEKLMQENDRLRRELRSETAKVRYKKIYPMFFFPATLSCSSVPEMKGGRGGEEKKELLW